MAEARKKRANIERENIRKNLLQQQQLHQDLLQLARVSTEEAAKVSTATSSNKQFLVKPVTWNSCGWT